MNWRSRLRSRLRLRLRLGTPIDPRHRLTRPGAPASESIDHLMHALRDDKPAPDVSAAVLARLGYVSASPVHVRRGRVLAFARRLGTTAAVFTLLGACVWTLHTSRMERARVGAIEDVVRTSLDQNRRWLGDVADGLAPLRRVPPQWQRDGGTSNRPIAPAVDDPTPDADEQPAEAPFRKS